MHGATASACATDSGLAKLGERALLAQRLLECSQLGVGTRGARDLGLHEGGVGALETMELEHEAADVA